MHDYMQSLNHIKISLYAMTYSDGDSSIKSKEQARVIQEHTIIQLTDDYYYQDIYICNKSVPCTNNKLVMKHFVNKFIIIFILITVENLKMILLLTLQILQK